MAWLISSISMPKPRRSAHRPYIRSRISLQSWASTPPSLALICTMQSASSCSPVNRLRRSSWRSCASIDPIDASMSASCDSSSTSRAISCSSSTSSRSPLSESKVSMSAFTLAYSVLTFLARSWSSHRSGRDDLELELGEALAARRRPSGSPRPRRGGGAALSDRRRSHAWMQWAVRLVKGSIRRRWRRGTA